MITGWVNILVVVILEILVITFYEWVNYGWKRDGRHENTLQQMAGRMKLHKSGFHHFPKAFSFTQTHHEFLLVHPLTATFSPHPRQCSTPFPARWCLPIVWSSVSRTTRAVRSTTKRVCVFSSHQMQTSCPVSFVGNFISRWNSSWPLEHWDAQTISWEPCLRVSMA
jgi:hypothetical protein